MKKFFYAIVFVLILMGSSVAFVRFYSYIFAKEVKGIIINVEKPTAPMAIVGSENANQKLAEKQLFSYAVAIQVEDGEIMTASTEDRQWSVAEKGKCVVAKFYPYPPWEFDKSGTYFGARLLRMHDCPKAQ
ncbi:MAG: hypothetical protein V4596_09605 [Bdellovibrionota bacterium]